MQHDNGSDLYLEHHVLFGINNSEIRKWRRLFFFFFFFGDPRKLNTFRTWAIM